MYIDLNINIYRGFSLMLKEGFVKEKRRHPDSNWGIKALQASALPLGHVAVLIILRQTNPICK